MKALDAVEAVQKVEGKPLHYTDLTRRILERGLWQTDGKMPEPALNTRLSTHVKALADASPFQLTRPGTFALCASVGHSSRRLQSAGCPA